MRYARIEEILKNAFQIHQLEIVDESHQHSGRAGQESHFKILLVSDDFLNMSRIQRQRKVNQLLDDEFQKGLHALTLRLLTSDEQGKQTSDFVSPNCQSLKT